MMESQECEACGGKMEFRREGSVQGWYCTNCDWAVVTTYIPEIERDMTKYEVRVIGADYHDEKQIKAVSTVSGLNFLEVRKLLQQENPVVFGGDATKVKVARDALAAAGLRCAISPPYRY